jgi:hypothetical protein
VTTLGGVVSHLDYHIPLNGRCPKNGVAWGILWNDMSLQERQGFDERANHVEPTVRVQEKRDGRAHKADETAKTQADIRNGGRRNRRGRESSSLIEQDGEEDQFGGGNNQVKVDVRPGESENDRGHLDDAEALVVAISAVPGNFMNMLRKRPAVVEGGQRDVSEGLDLIAVQPRCEFQEIRFSHLGEVRRGEGAEDGCHRVNDWRDFQEQLGKGESERMPRVINQGEEL